MVYRIDQPVAGSSLRKSQPKLLENTVALNTVFGIDHLPFNNETTDIGFHTQVTNPVQGSAPATAADQTRLYTITPHATIGPMQFTRGESNAVPTPLTNRNAVIANVAALSAITILDFTGTPTSNGVAIFQGLDASLALFSIIQSFSWDGTRLVVSTAASTSKRFLVSTTNLQLRSNSDLTNVYWSLSFYRCST